MRHTSTLFASARLATLLVLLTIPPALAVIPAPAAAGGGNSDQSQSDLVPPIDAPDANATGHVEIGKSGQEQEFNVTAEKLDSESPPGPFEVWLEDGIASGNFVKVGNMNLKSPAQGKWELKLEEVGAAPPALGVGDVNDTAGRVVQVRDAGGAVTYLTGIIAPILPGGCNPVTPAVKGEMDLQRPASQPDPDAKGRLRMSKRGKEQEFVVEAEKLDAPANAQYNVFLETAVASDVYSPIGGMNLKNAVKGTWKFELEAQCAAPSILGVNDVTLVSGRRVQVRNAKSDVVLFGVLPQLVVGIGQLNFNLKSKLLLPMVNPPSPDGRGDVRSRFLAKKGQSEFEVRIYDLAVGKTYSLWLETLNGSGILEEVGSFTFQGTTSKHGKFSVNTVKGEGLPYGVNTIAGLKNRNLEVRDAQNAVHLTGIVP
jgi:hypothetical protein